MSKTTDFDLINDKIKRLGFLLSSEDLHVEDTNVREALTKFLKLKEITGNIDMDIHFLVSCLAKSFLKNRHNVDIDLSKPVGSAGLDIELEQVVAEIKTTIPYGKNDFGANQKESIEKDLRRLEGSKKKYKYFFVIDNKTEKILKQKYSRNYPSVLIFNLLKESLDNESKRNLSVRR